MSGLVSHHHRGGGAGCGGPATPSGGGVPVEEHSQAAALVDVAAQFIDPEGNFPPVITRAEHAGRAGSTCTGTHRGSKLPWTGVMGISGLAILL